MLQQPLAGMSHLVVLDVQPKAIRNMPTELQTMVENCSLLVETAKLLNIPVIVTEHFPVELGETIPEIAQHFGTTKPLAKTTNSAFKNDGFKVRLQKNRPQIFLIGLEAHRCVQQTALDLMANDWEVYVIDDAVISHQTINKTTALKSLSFKGPTILNTQSVIDGWLRVVPSKLEESNSEDKVI